MRQVGPFCASNASVIQLNIWLTIAKAGRETISHRMAGIRALARQIKINATQIEAGNLESCDEWGLQFVGQNTCDLQPINFGGEL